MKKYKKKYFVVLFGICMLICSCTDTLKNKVELNGDMTNLKSSMIDFFDAEDQGFVKGETFQAKMLSCYKVLFNSDEYDTSYAKYRYQLVIAPVTNEPVRINNIHFSLNSPRLIDYYKEHQNNGRNGLFDEQIGELTPDAFEYWQDETQMIANQFDFTISNMGDDWQSEAGIPNQEFDQGLTELLITIDYNNTSETLLLKYSNELVTISSLEQVDSLNRIDIEELYFTGTTRDSMYPFEK